jgi:hypothetical protein
MRGLLFAVALFCLAALSVANSIDKDVVAFVKALSFSDLKMMKKVSCRHAHCIPFTF